MQYTDLSTVEIIVADNGSSDDSVKFLKENYPDVKLIELPENFGFAGGYNRALENVHADIFCILNSDVAVSKNWISFVLSIFENEHNVVAIQPKILSERDVNRFEHAGAAGGYIDKFSYPFCRGRIMNAIELDVGQYNTQSDIFWASGACLFIRSAIFKEFGGFDSDYFAHMEEIDLCWRIKNQGHRIVYCPQSIVYHYGGATLEYNNPRKLFLNFRNSLWTLYKNYTGKYLWWIMFRRMLIDSLAIIKFFVSFDLKNAFAVIGAHFAFYFSMKDLKKKRKALKQKVKVTSHPEMLKSSIVLEFFLKSKKVYGDLHQFKPAIRYKKRK